MAEGGLDVWSKEIPGTKIPGTSRIPAAEILNFYKGNTNQLRGLDVGSGKGRSTDVLKNALPGAEIHALDLSFEGLLLTDAKSRVQASIEHLPYTDNSFDFLSVCGVMTNLVDNDPNRAKALRHKAASELYRTLKPNGCVVISDFGAEHLIDTYKVDYKRHAVITGEEGTIAVLKQGGTFAGKSEEELKSMRGTDMIERYAHHFTPKEIIDILKEAGFSVNQYAVELTETPNGKRSIENIIVTASKPENNTEN